MGADKTYIAEMNKRAKELETGKVMGLTVEELAVRARLANKKKHLCKKIPSVNYLKAIANSSGFFYALDDFKIT